jgi:hypothetical protein
MSRPRLKRIASHDPLLSLGDERGEHGAFGSQALDQIGSVRARADRLTVDGARGPFRQKQGRNSAGVSKKCQGNGQNRSLVALETCSLTLTGGAFDPMTPWRNSTTYLPECGRRRARAGAATMCPYGSGIDLGP